MANDATTASSNDGKMNPESAPEKSEKILKQIEYYFGDINLPRDKFLQEEMKKDNGWIPLSTMLKFNRLAAITTDLDSITSALHNSHLVDVSDDNQKIRRNPEVPIPENTLEYWQEIKRRTTYLKGFPQDVSLDEIAQFVNQFGAVQNIVMRKTKGGKETPRVFKGSVFVTYSNQDEAKKLAAQKDLKFKEIHELVNMMQDDYWAGKYSERQKKKELKNQMRKTQIEQQNKQHYKKGMVLKLSGFEQQPKEGADDKAAEPKQDVEQVNDIKEFFKSHGDPIFVIVNGNEATIRFHGDEGSAAQDAWKKALEASSKDGKLNFNGTLLEGSVLEGDEESKYWTEFVKAKLAKSQGKKMVKGKKGKNIQSRKRRADKGLGHGGDGEPKGKRTVFQDEDGDEAIEDDDEENGEGEEADDGVVEKKPKVDA